MVELREVRVFLTLAEELHFGRTAEQLGLTQSRVSQTIRTLETKLGDHLVQRTSRRVALTAAGERFLERVEPRYTALLEELERSSRATHLQGVLRLGVSYAAAVSPEMLKVIESFESKHSRCRVEIAELPFRERHAPLRRGDVDLMITRLPINQPGLVTGPVLTREPRILAVARDHPLVARASVSLEEIGGYKVAALNEIAPKDLGDAYVPPKTPSGRPIKRVRAPVRDFSDLVVLIARGRIVQPTVASAASRFSHPNIVCIPISDMPQAETALAWQRRANDPRLHALIKLAREHLSVAAPQTNTRQQPY